MAKAIRFGLTGAVMVVVGRLAATGRLPRNILAGIRIPSTMRSDEAWRAGHRAAASALTAAGVGPMVVAVVARVMKADPDTQTTLFRIGKVWLFGWLGIATFQASQAARMKDVG
jgi:uncharacterized membrane protein